MTLLRVFPHFIILIMLAGLGGAAHCYYGQASSWRKKAHVAENLFRQQTISLQQANQRQKTLADLDTQLTEKLVHAENESTILRAQLASGARRMYIQANHTLRSGSNVTSACRMGDATTVELSGKTGQDLLSIREEIIRDRKKIKYLQEYIRIGCMREAH
ncbi:lysis system i-spanin subunit Rz [Pseudomonas synxantha]|uniref:lysis system i-spanin subunit Rz n=1 Tax=Pseudomonas synxantha TaxID=47883 RepID=UPI000695CF2F|nr:lysis system i-spanin subunit Rz [Pseudomonas synxantha]